LLLRIFSKALEFMPIDLEARSNIISEEKEGFLPLPLKDSEKTKSTIFLSELTILLAEGK